VFYASTDNVYVTKELWIDIIDKFITVITPHIRGREALFFLDRLDSHQSIEAAKKLLENNIHCFFFLPHMTYWIQPLDNVVLANWKRVIKNQVRHQARSFLLHRH
jgi:hypothetical protein